MQIKLITNEDEFDALGDDWNALVTGNPRYSLFNSYICNRTWWRHHAHLGELSIFVAFDDDKVHGIAPLYRLTTSRFRFLKLNTLCFIGRGASTTPDDLDIIVRDDNAVAITTELVTAILADSQAQRIHLRDIPATSPSREVLDSQVQSISSSGITVALNASPEVSRQIATLPDQWQSYLSAQSRNFRKQIKRRNNRLARTGNAEFSLCKTESDIDKAFEALKRLHHERWQAKPGESSESFQETAYLTFHRELMTQLSADDQLWLLVFTLDEKIVGIEYAFSCNKRLLLFQTGFATDVTELAPGHLMMSRLFELAIEGGISEIDFLKGDYEYKDSYANGTRATLDIDIVKGRVPVMVTRAASIVRKLVRR